jgi:phosphate starvation-inducible protein PhoH
MGYNRQLEAARIVAAPPENTGNPKKDLQRPSEELIKGITAMDENIAMQQIMQGAANGKYQDRDPSQITSTSALCAQAVPLRESDGGGVADDEESIRAYSRLALEKTGQIEGLNSSQRLAVHHAVTNRLTLVQGPPGTGKTAVAIKIMSHWAKISNRCAERSGKTSARERSEGARAH